VIAQWLASADSSGPNVPVGSGPLADFGITASFAGEHAVLGIRGDVDTVSAPVLGALFDAVIDSGYPAVLMDLPDPDSIDAVGLAMTAGAASRLVAQGGQLTIRFSSTGVARIFDIGWMAELISKALRGPSGDHLAPEQTTSEFTAIGAADAAPNLRTVTGASTTEDVVNSALRLVVALARATVSGADGASVTLRRLGQLATVAASDSTISDMDANQYATGEGPCIDASVEGRWFHAESLEEETRWPAFTPRARSLGINAILSSPLVANGQPVGALNIYSRTALAFATKEQELAAVFAAEASRVLTASQAVAIDDQLTTRLQEALRTREVIAEAQGVIMARQGVGENEAFDILRHLSQTSNRSLRERAEIVVDSTQPTQPDLELGPVGSP
jgi:anti-anti-sigma factor